MHILLKRSLVLVYLFKDIFMYLSSGHLNMKWKRRRETSEVCMSAVWKVESR